jgi:acetyltransferase (GNAT) family protein
VSTRAASTSLQYSPLDSERFGLRIYRGELTTIDAESLVQEMRREKIDTLIARIPAEIVGSAARLHSSGLMPIVADTHVEYDIHLAEVERRETASSVQFVSVTARDRVRLLQIVGEIFDDYPSHYRANPLLAPKAIADGYADWAVRHIEDEDAKIWFVQNSDEVVGFAVCRIERESNIIRGVLNGILPAMRGKGLYRAMFHNMLHRSAREGARTFAIATQAHNIAVQRVWAEAGLKLRSVKNTLHVNRSDLSCC